jgi:hypothetical protein
MVTEVDDGPDSDAGCQRGDEADLEIGHSLARAVDDLPAAVADVRGPDHFTGAVDCDELRESWAG